ncbi:TKL protein kinase [Saprolegnia parasitica CBS 223.65]|uniref:TKL protein kinase n=1 Tax=Saprolegnia parasitica (strain CBS 223.65) TaxID=695850 RepID=A0A067BTP6_SAPPC|nr:TKL protein kinase [Saprolegnia parasitica CBS 223.65]KDO21909.1 TKL protein kinase [Saprolegnia parasitica CBS 223.65]|eukprot:XP_012207388.1 TKL protein kinase [Saprolegnia parasitica CBS 223.65]
MSLVDAVARGDLAAVAEFLHDGADPDSRNKIGEPALFVAVMEGHVNIAEMLLNAGAAVDLETPGGATALMMSPACRSAEFVQLLLDRGADVNHTNGNATTLAAAVQLGLDDVVEVLLAARANVNDNNTYNKASPIVVAAERGLQTLASRLLLAGANLHSVDKEGYGAVFHAANRGHADMIRFLVDKGADPNTTAPNGVTPLYAACLRGHVAAVIALLQAGANVNHPDADPCIVPAAAYDHSTIISVLLSHNVDVNAVDFTYRATALYAAAMNGHVAVVRQLAYARAELDKPASDGSTPVMVARDNCVLQVLHDVRTKKMELLHAARHGNVAVVRALFDEGLSVNERDEHGNTLVHLALLGRDVALLTELLKDPAVDTSCVNKFHESPTAIAAKSGIQSLIQKLHHCQNKPVVKVATRSTVHLQEVGRGGYGIVFKDTLFGQDVAVKMLLNSSSKAKNLRYEIEILENNPSPYLVRLLATADAKSDAPQLIFEYMDGGNLTSYLEKLANDESVPVVYTPIEILWVVANALNDLHAKNVVHRDIKPDNILLSSTYYIKVGDVGIAKEESTNMTTGAGTSKWRAPEVLTSGSRYGTPADIYSFGILLQTLYPNPTDASTEWAQALAAKCTTIDPTRRPTAAKLVDLLRPMLQSEPHLVTSMLAFEQDRAEGLQVLETISMPTDVQDAAMPGMPAAPIMPSRIGRPQSPLTPEEALHVAVDTGKYDDVRTLLASGVHPDCATNGRETPLMKAVHFGYGDIADLLLEYRANVNIAIFNGMTALHSAAGQSDSAMLDKLLRIKNVNVKGEPNVRTPNAIACCDCGRHVANAIALLDAGADLEAADEEMERPLHFAAIYGHKDIAAVLLARGARTSDRNQNGDTALHLAIQHKHGDVATLLVEAGADISVLSKGQSPMHCACQHGVVDVIPALIARGADVNSQFNLTSPLMMATHHNHADVVRALLQLPGIDINRPNAHGVTALHVAASTKCYEIVRMLLQAGVDVGVRAIDLVKPDTDRAMLELLRPAYEHRERLLEAMHLADVGQLAYLLEQPYSCNIKDELGCSLVHLAVLADNEAMLDLLLAETRVNLATLNNEKKTPLAIAIERCYGSMAKKLFDRTLQPVVEISTTEYVETQTELGFGAFGVVVLGSYAGQKVAIKKFRHADCLKSFEAEVGTLLACPSPYLVQLVAIADRNSKTPTLLFEYMDGGSLRMHLEKKRINTHTAAHVTNLHVAWVVANALLHLHAKNFIHRDVKSDNVLLNSSDEIKLADLGLARPEATSMTEAPGTPYWMAPEVLQADGAVYGCPADIYAFGVLLTELDTCELPYFDQDVQDRIAFNRGVINGTLRPTLTTDCEPWLRQLAERCLHADPKARPTAASIVEMLSVEMAAAPPPGMSVAKTYLHAVATDDVDTVAQLLTHGVALDWKLPGGASLLLAATAARATKTVKFLLDRGANVNDPSGGQTPLHAAVTKSLEEFLLILIDAGADVEARDQDGRTPLAFALKNQLLQCVTALLATGASVERLDEDGWELLDMAKRDQSLADLVRMLHIAASRKENVAKPEIFCVKCGNWHAVAANCSCNHNASPTDRMVAVVRRLMRLHHRGYAVNWMLACASTTCHQSTMTIVDAICPECGTESPKSITMMLNFRLKHALQQPTSAQEVPRIPRRILRWLASHRDPLPPAAPSSTNMMQRRSERRMRGHSAEGLARDMAFLAMLASRPMQQNDPMPWATAGMFGRAALARDLYASMSEPIAGETLPKAGVPMMLHDQLVVHYHIGDDDDLEAIAMCASPFLVPIVATASPKSVLLEASRALTLQNTLLVPGARSRMLAAAPTLLQILYVIANALLDVHERSLVHGHLSSHNVFMSRIGGIQVGVPGMSATDEALLAWTAPEVLTGDAPPSSASDIYAFGILMTELNTFQLPFDDFNFDDEVALTTAVVDGGLRPTLRDDCDAWYRTLVRRCVDADPLNRPTAKDLVELLQERLDDTIGMRNA